MSRLIDLTSQRFGRLVVVARVENSGDGRARWTCRCDCGTIRIVLSDHLRRGNIRSCGCSRRTHGQTIGRTKSRAFSIWDTMVQRCTNRNRAVWKYYGGRGITVCKRWLEFVNFLTDMGNPPTKKHQLDRIDNNKGYCPSNCRWVTSKTNNRNRRNNRLITYRDQTQCLSALAEEYGINRQALRRRITSGWPMHRALTEPTRKYRGKGGGRKCT